MSEKEFRK